MALTRNDYKALSQARLEAQMIDLHTRNLRRITDAHPEIVTEDMRNTQAVVETTTAALSMAIGSALVAHLKARSSDKDATPTNE